MYLDSWVLTPVGISRLIIHCLLAFSVASVVYYLQYKIFKRIHIYLLKTPSILDDTLVHALFLPLSLLIWIYTITSIAEYILVSMQHPGWAQEIIRIRAEGYIFLLIWLFWRYTSLVEKHLAHVTQMKRRIDKGTIITIAHFVRIGLGTIVLLISLEALGVPLSGVIAFGGGGALAMGIAAQHILANWFGGLMIFLDKPFKPDEWITSPDRSIEGKVVEIGWRTTKIIGPDNRPLYIPNSIFSQVIIANAQRITHRKIEATIGLRHEDAGVIESIVKSIDTMLRTYPAVDLGERYMVHFVGFDNSALNIHFLCSVKEPDFNVWRDIQQEILLKVVDIVTKHEAQFAYTNMITHFPEGCFIQKK